jgi:hypothetical protein
VVPPKVRGVPRTGHRLSRTEYIGGADFPVCGSQTGKPVLPIFDTRACGNGGSPANHQDATAPILSATPEAFFPSFPAPPHTLRGSLCRSLRYSPSCFNPYPMQRPDAITPNGTRRSRRCQSVRTADDSSPRYAGRRGRTTSTIALPSVRCWSASRCTPSTRLVAVTAPASKKGQSRIMHMSR